MGCDSEIVTHRVEEHVVPLQIIKILLLSKNCVAKDY